MFSKAIVRRPSLSMVNGITAHPELGKPDFKLAARQHDAYIAAPHGVKSARQSGHTGSMALNPRQFSTRGSPSLG